MPNEIIPFNDLQSMARAVAAGGMFPSVKSPEQAITLMLLAQAENLHPMNALRRFHIIDGKPSMRADTMLASYRAKGGRAIWVTKADDTGKQVARWTYDGNDLEIGYTIDEARKAGYVRQGSNWTKDPASQLRARAITRAVRMLCPEVVVGIYTPEELEDVANTSGAPIKPMPAATTEATVLESKVGTGPAQAPAAPATAVNSPATSMAQAATPGEAPEAFQGRMKHIRAKLNAELQLCKDEDGFKAARKGLRAAHGDTIENMLTFHSGNETFRDLMTDHWKRISGDNQVKAWRAAVENAQDMRDIDPLMGAYLDPKNECLRTTENKESAGQQGRGPGASRFRRRWPGDHGSK